MLRGGGLFKHPHDGPPSGRRGPRDGTVFYPGPSKVVPSMGRREGARRARRMRPRVRVRPATLKDLPVLVRHRRRMWEDIDREGPPRGDLLDAADRVYRRWAGARLRSGALRGFIAEDPEGHPLGSGCVWLMESQPRPWWDGMVVPYILSMFTEREARGQGVASDIVTTILAYCRAHRFPRVVLHASDMGRGVYERLGFEPGREMRYTLFDARGGGALAPGGGARVAPRDPTAAERPGRAGASKRRGRRASPRGARRAPP